MKNITITVDPRLYRRARVYAAERDTTLTALVREILTTLVETGFDDFDRHLGPPGDAEEGPPLFPVILGDCETRPTRLDCPSPTFTHL